MQVKIDGKAIDVAASRPHDIRAACSKAEHIALTQRMESCGCQGERRCRDATASNRTGRWSNNVRLC